ncbi:MAG: DegV family protein [Anaerolineales bacterium]
MQIVTDSGTDLNLSKEEAAEYNVHVVPLTVTLDGKSYLEGIDIEPGDFYDLLAASDNLPITSQPSAGQFADLYRRLAADDPEILSIHMTSGLSGTFNSALAGADLVPEANVTHVDTKTLSAAAGWQVEAAARTNKAGWALDRILDLIKRIGDSCESVYTLDELKYLIHGGRISHMKGIIASLINIKPLIGVEKVNGTYSQLGQVRTFKGALKGLVKQIEKKFQLGSKIHVQVLHSFNPEAATFLREQVDKLYDCTWMPIGPMSLVLGAHTGPSMVGLGFGDQVIFDEIP